MRNIESQIQKMCVKWFRLQYPRLGKLLFAVPNGGHRNRITASILKAEGVVAGVADLLLLVPNSTYHGLCIEMKRSKAVNVARGRQTESQREWQTLVEHQGYQYCVVHSLDEFREIVQSYLKDCTFH